MASLKLKLLAALFGVLPAERALAWRSLKQRQVEITTSVEAPMGMLETQWGSPYYELRSVPTSYGANFLMEVSIVGQNISDYRLDELAQENLCAVDNMTAGTNSKFYLAHRGVATADKCQIVCKNNPICSAAVFDSTKSMCTLVTELKGLTRKEGSKVVLPNCETSCFENNKRRSSAVASTLGNVPNANVCQAMCQALSNCRAFTWKKSTGACTAHSSFWGHTEDPDAVSGPASSCVQRGKSFEAAGPCIFTAYSGYIHSNLAIHRSITSTDACRVTCMKNPRCQWYTYNKRTGICYLKPQRGSVVKSSEQADDTGPRNCDTSCYQEDAKVVTSAPPLSSNTELTLVFCHDRCIMNSKCRAFTYNKETKVCHLYPAAQGVFEVESAEKHVSGTNELCSIDKLYASIGASECAMRGVRYKTDAGPFATNEKDDALSCQNACEADPACEAYAYNARTKECHFNIALAETKKEWNNNFISGPKFCNKCFQYGKETRGNVIASFLEGSEFSVEECQLKCQALTNCNYFTFAGQQRKCYLYDTTTGQADASFLIAGPKYCSEACDLPNFAVRGSGFEPPKKVTQSGYAACRDACKKESFCKTFSVEKSNGSCFLSSEAGMYDYYPNNNFTSGYPTCSTCFRQGVGYDTTKGLLWALKTNNPEECARRCESMEMCTRFTYNLKEAKCYMLSGENKNVYDDNLVSGKSNCGAVDTACIKSNHWLQNGWNITKVYLKTAAACQVECQKNVDCKMFTFDHRTGECFLKPAVVSSILKAKPNWSGGMKKCTRAITSSFCDTNYEYVGQGGDMFNVSSNSIADCVHYCYLQPDCRIWSQFDQTKKCYLKRDAAVKDIRPASSSVHSSIRLGCPKCLRANFGNTGEPFRTEATQSYVFCQMLCSADPKCMSFTQKGSKCALFSSLTDLVSNDGAVTGPKRC